MFSDFEKDLGDSGPLLTEAMLIVYYVGIDHGSDPVENQPIIYFCHDKYQSDTSKVIG